MKNLLTTVALVGLVFYALAGCSGSRSVSPDKPGSSDEASGAGTDKDEAAAITLAEGPLHHNARNLGGGDLYWALAYGVDTRYVDGATSLDAPPAGSIGLGSVFNPLVW
jgi:hypothetical protein